MTLAKWWTSVSFTVSHSKIPVGIHSTYALQQHEAFSSWTVMLQIRLCCSDKVPAACECRDFAHRSNVFDCTHLGIAMMHAFHRCGLFVSLPVRRSTHRGIPLAIAAILNNNAQNMWCHWSFQYLTVNMQGTLQMLSRNDPRLDLLSSEH